VKNREREGIGIERKLTNKLNEYAFDKTNLIFHKASFENNNKPHIQDRRLSNGRDTVSSLFRGLPHRESSAFPPITNNAIFSFRRWSCAIFPTAEL